MASLDDGQRQDQPGTSLRAQPRDGLLQRNDRPNNAESAETLMPSGNP